MDYENVVAKEETQESLVFLREERKRGEYLYVPRSQDLPRIRYQTELQNDVRGQETSILRQRSFNNDNN